LPKTYCFEWLIQYPPLEGFPERFRHNAFGGRSQPAIERVREAVAEIRKAARRNPVLAADGAMLFPEKVHTSQELANVT
jgi:hypothetical protein